MKRILIVEDDDFLREIYVEKLMDNLDIEILTARNGNEGMELVRSHKHIGMIVSDISMPDGSGYDLLKYLSDFNLKIPLVFFSSNIDPKIDTSYENFLGVIDKNHFTQLYALISRQFEST